MSSDEWKVLWGMIAFMGIVAAFVYTINGGW